MNAHSFFLYNTVNSIQTDAGPDGLRAAMAQAEAYELLFSRTHPESQLFAVNEAHGRPTPVDAELSALTQAALGYCEATGGLFDITMGSVVRLWSANPGTVPSRAAIEQALTHVDWRTVRASDRTIALSDPQACIDLGGVAKGRIADGLLDVLEAQGATHSLVNLGGNVAARGSKPDGAPWRVGLRRPEPSMSLGAQAHFAVVELAEGSVVTSGVYERAFQLNGRTYHHILDPRTGFPAETDVLSATVVSKRSIDGDGFTTALVIMGADDALAFVESTPGLEAVIVSNEGDVLGTSGIGASIGFRVLDR
ncbi:FAD:protein FMN transferase [Eggerthellaceae bacterium zg-1084]|uniref:FAD:protein FMN transferase n=1 Tax=Berryella wangjianweii TaxID=2734634 RepID=A0A6M8J2K5_9ACTN|nr:FAD:protein FMN transferase [Berryella wangjianweii]NPD31628.1 FAD:protein FMN transferase [Berryella wangjianweii]NPD32877.1 FAD:protein FMN transferase [Eggerthellaceae bacterium zg-997]QKF07754.1 FAD:protein FMN transferase [Berryella wangjianweii]